MVEGRNRRRLKVLFLTSWYPTRETPAKGTFVREHAKAVRLYDDVVVLHCHELSPDLASPWRFEQEHNEELTQGIPTYRALYRRSPAPKTSYFAYLWGVLRAYRRIVETGFRPQVIHAHVFEAGVPAVLIGRLYGLPVVITEHFSAFIRKALGSAELHKARFAFGQARLVMPVSAALQAGIEGCGIRARFRVVPNAIDTDLFSPPVKDRGDRENALDCKEGEALDRREGVKRLLFVGALSPAKGMEHLLAALTQLLRERTDWRLDVVGEGPNQADDERMSAQMGLGAYVAFHGRMPKAEVASFMRQADVYVLPSLVETFSVSLAEAMATGLPVVATRCGGPEEYVTESAGVLVPPGDALALYQGLRAVLNDLNRYSAEQISALIRQRFGARSVGSQLDAIYREVTGVTDEASYADLDGQGRPGASGEAQR